MARLLIYNMTQEPVSVILNGGPAGDVAAAVLGRAFAPSPPLAVERSGLPEPGRFGSTWPNGLVLISTSGGQARSLELVIGDELYDRDDLRLFLFSGHALLTDDRVETMVRMRS